MFKKIDINEAKAKVSAAVNDYEMTLNLLEKTIAILAPYVGHTFNNSIIKKTKEDAERNGLDLYLVEHYGTIDFHARPLDWHLNRHGITKMVRRQPQPIPRLSEEWLDDFRERRRRYSALLGLIRDREIMLEGFVANWNDKLDELEKVRERITGVEGDDLTSELYPYSLIFSLSNR